MVVVVTGANGQLGQSIQFIANNYPEIHFIFCDSATLDITNIDSCNLIFATYKPDFCINAAAYTAVDRAETEPEKAFDVNVLGAKNLAEVCKTHDTVLLHVSTDFVFDGKKTTPYTEQDTPHPTGVYGQTKREGEQAIEQTWEKHYIVRTSWVYSQFGANFMKTMLRLASERASLSVVNDQIGTPTNAVDLATCLAQICLTHNPQPTTHNYGIYNYSNEGQCSWFEFAKAIFEKNNIKIQIHPIATSEYPTAANRPAYSVLDKSKIKKVFGVEVKNWEESLAAIQ
jgi:dTDP-4-dehydrorhamnose reductase